MKQSLWETEVFPWKNVQLKTIDGADAERRSRALKGSLCLFSDTYIDMYMYFQASPFTVRRCAILKSRASRRTRIMAQPKFVTKKYDPA